MKIKLEDLAHALLITMGIIVVVFMILTMVFIADIFTLQKVGTKEVKCIDRVGAEFVDEMCTKSVYCSSLGIAGSRKCKK